MEARGVHWWQVTATAQGVIGKQAKRGIMTIESEGVPLIDVGELLHQAAALPLPLDIEGLVARIGLELHYQMNLSSAVSGYLYRGSMGPVIVINGRRPKVRQRFTIAHELMHWSLNDPGICFKLRENREGYADAERRADRYAARLLMPADKIRDLWSADKSAGVMMRAFGVSHAALLLRLYELDIVGAEGDSYDAEYVRALAGV